METIWDSEDIIRGHWDNFWSDEIKGKVLAQFGYSIDSDSRYLSDEEIEDRGIRVRCWNGRDPGCDVPEIDVVTVSWSREEFDSEAEAYAAAVNALLEEWDPDYVWEIVCNPNRNAVRECAEAEEQARAAKAGRA